MNKTKIFGYDNKNEVVYRGTERSEAIDLLKEKGGGYLSQYEIIQDTVWITKTEVKIKFPVIKGYDKEWSISDNTMLLSESELEYLIDLYKHN